MPVSVVAVHHRQYSDNNRLVFAVVNLSIRNPVGVAVSKSYVEVHRLVATKTVVVLLDYKSRIVVLNYVKGNKKENLSSWMEKMLATYGG